MKIQAALTRLLDSSDLSGEEMTAVMEQVMTGEATPAQIGGFLVALRMKGETVDEVAAAASVMRRLATTVDVDPDRATDIVGTGGDASHTFNISTASALVAAAAGVCVAKHGNRSVSSQSGAADFLEAAGVNIELDAESVASCIREAGIGFMFAPRHHSAMRHAIGPRREMAVRTVFNLLGPLTNPAGARRQLLGVYSADWVRPIAEVLGKLGSVHAMVVHGEDGMDEISLSTRTRVAELKAGVVREYEIQPSDFALEMASLDAIQVQGPVESLERIRAVLANEAGPARDVVLLNAGAAIHVGGQANDLAEGIDRARAVLADGSAADKLSELARVSSALGA